MKILLLCDKPPWPGDSGGSLASQSMISNIIRDNHELTVFFLKTTKHTGGLDEIPSDIISRSVMIQVDHDTGFSLFSALFNLLFSGRPYNLERFRSDRVKRELLSLFEHNRFDIVQFEGLAMNNYYETARQASEAILVMRSHNVEHGIWQGLSEESNNPFKKIYYSILAKRIFNIEKKYLGMYDGLISISPDDLVKFREMGITTRAITIYPVMDIKVPGSDNRADGSKAIGYIGSLDWIPNTYGLKWFIKKVWPVVRKNIPGCRFVIGGRNPGRSLLKAIKLSDAEYIGEPPSSADFLRSVDLLAVPLFSGAGIRIKIIEALLNKTKVITTKKGAEGLPEEVASRLPITDDAAAMSRIIIELLSGNEDNFNSSGLMDDIVPRFFGKLADKEVLSDYYTSLADEF